MKLDLGASRCFLLYSLGSLCGRIRVKSGLALGALAVVRQDKVYEKEYNKYSFILYIGITSSNLILNIR